MDVMLECHHAILNMDLGRGLTHPQIFTTVTSEELDKIIEHDLMNHYLEFKQHYTQKRL